MAGIAEFTPEFFDSASSAWRANKLRLAEGMFRYKRNAFSEAKEPVTPTQRRPVNAKKQQLRRSPRLLAKKRAKIQVAK